MRIVECTETVAQRDDKFFNDQLPYNTLLVNVFDNKIPVSKILTQNIG